MRHLKGLKNQKLYKLPKNFSDLTDLEFKMALGALLYMAGTRKNWAEKYIDGKYNSMTSIVIDFEDALNKSSYSDALEITKTNLRILEKCLCNDISKIPLIFIRINGIENLDGIRDYFQKEKLIQYIKGFILPKATAKTTELACNMIGDDKFIMPIIESRSFIDKDTRMKELKDFRYLLNEREDIKKKVLNIRVGGTDLSGVYGLRRNIENTIYDIKVVESCLIDVVNYLGNIEGIVISGPVWEYFGTRDALAGLIKEVKLDKVNGFIGKTTIHPSQIDIVNFAYIVEYKDYIDARNILYGEQSVENGIEGNRMNELNPHRKWAEKTMKLSNVFGVLDKYQNIDDIYQDILSKIKQK